MAKNDNAKKKEIEDSIVVSEPVEVDEDVIAEQAQTDAEIANRTARYDQDLKERARTYGINPDNFATEEALGETVKKYEDENNILGTPEDKENSNV